MNIIHTLLWVREPVADGEFAALETVCITETFQKRYTSVRR